MTPKASGLPTDLPIHQFDTADEWEAWLEANHEGSPGVYLRVAKKASPVETVAITDALDIALCFGWIDSVRLRGDEHTYLQRYTPRKRRSVWSQINREKVEKLIAEGRMRPAGHAEIERAKEDGRWADAYPPASRAEVPPDLQAALDANPAARDFFETLTGSNRYAFLYRLHSAKREETRKRRLEKFIAMLARGEKL